MKNVAVVAVHGVGTHSPHATAEAVEQLLLRMQGSDGTAQYTSFHEEALDIPCTPLAPGSKPPNTSSSLFNERLRRLRSSPTPSTPSSDADAANRRLMDALLDDYTPTSSDKVYESVRFNGQRLEGGAPQTNVHIYEMFWSDISAIGNTFWSVFGDLYQLIIHLPIIGLQTLDFAAQSDTVPRRRWKWLGGLYRVALRAFTAFLPTLNLLMLALCLPSLVLQQFSPRTQLWLVAGVAAIAGTAFLINRQTRSNTSASDWPRALSVVPLAIVGAAALLRHRIDVIIVQRYAILTCWIAMAVVLHVVLKSFNRSRPGVYRIGWMSFVALSMILLFYSLGGGGKPTQLDALLYTFEWAYVAQFLSWLVFVMAASGFILVSWFTVPCKETRLRKAAATARLALAVPAFVFIVVTTLFWGAIYYGPGRQLLPTQAIYQSRFCYPALELSKPVVSTVIPTRCPVVVAPAAFGPGYEGGGASRLALLAAVMVALAALALLFALGPSILAELRPADDTGTPGRSQALGAWLTFGLRAGRVSSLLVSIALLVACAATLLVVPYWPSIGAPAWVVALRNRIGAVPTTLQLLRFGGVLIASGSAIGIVALSKRFTRVGLGLKPALASALDVEVYFRELPHRRTPRARMVSRYASLLRHLCRWRDASSQGYDAIVIVAHSQGTVITVDLLRYLQGTSRADPALDCLQSGARSGGIPVLLLTLGCPLYQLYARRFPHLYRWVASGNLGAPSTTPDKKDLRGVTQWVNLYRSGDYIGRALWRGEGPEAYDTVPPTGPAPTEACLGPGAHTHYLDPTSLAVASELDRLIGSV